MKTFIVSTNEYSQDEQTKFHEYSKEHGFGWWHWFDNMWILATDNDTTPKQLSDQLLAISENSFLIIEIDCKNWYGRGPKSDESNMFEWLHENLLK